MSTVINGSASVTINSGAVLGITSGTAVASTSGTSIDFTSIPAWVKRITVMFSSVSSSGTSNYLIQIGSGSLTTSGYGAGSGAIIAQMTYSTAGFIQSQAMVAANSYSGAYTIFLVGSNIYVGSGGLGTTNNNNVAFINNGTVTLGGTLDRVRITTVNGTDLFDAGSINIMYEG